MASTELRNRGKSAPTEQNSLPAASANIDKKVNSNQQTEHGLAVQLLRMLLFASWFNGCCMVIVATQLLGSPLYFYDKDWYYAYMALTKQSFGLVVTTITQWFSPTKIRVSGDASVQEQLRQASDGRLVTLFPERLVLIANHQIYTDWIYLWWSAYTSRMHGHIYIVLKESLKHIPLMGWGMQFYGFIFMARKWADDKPRLQHRLQKLKAQHGGPMAGSSSYDPMWFLLYPEGTNMSPNTSRKNHEWAVKQGIPDMEHVLLPRSTGLQFCLQELKGTVNWVYDCTVGYEGTPKGQFACNVFTLRSTYFQGRPPKSVNMYWRRFHMSTIPVDDPKAFEVWINDRWREKGMLMQQFVETGRFPPSESILTKRGKETNAYIETEVKLEKWYEVGQIFVTLAAFALVFDILAKIWNMLLWPIRGWV